MPTIELKPEEALVLVEFLLRFRDQGKLSIEHKAEVNMLWNLCALLESQVPELLDPAYAQKLVQAREVVTGPELERHAAPQRIMPGLQDEGDDFRKLARVPIRGGPVAHGHPAE